MTDHDEDTVRRARQGDRDAHAALYRRFSATVYTLACRMLQRPALADDVLQETFLEVFRKIEGFRGDAPPGVWIRRIAVNKCLMYLRSGWHRHMLSDDGLPETRDPADGQRMQSSLDLNQALGSLTGTARAVVWLHDVEGYTHREIGEMMGKTTSFSKSQLARAHARLRVILTNDGKEQCMQVSNSF